MTLKEQPAQQNSGKSLFSMKNKAKSQVSQQGQILKNYGEKEKKKMVAKLLPRHDLICIFYADSENVMDNFFSIIF